MEDEGGTIGAESEELTAQRRRSSAEAEFQRIRVAAQLISLKGQNGNLGYGESEKQSADRKSAFRKTPEGVDGEGGGELGELKLGESEANPVVRVAGGDVPGDDFVQARWRGLDQRRGGVPVDCGDKLGWDEG